MKPKYCLPALLYLCLTAHLCPAQSTMRTVSAASRSLSIGEVCPDIPLTFTTGEQKRLSAYRNKPVVLVFMSIYCGTCVQELPQLQHLRDRFADSLDLLLVLRENKTDVTTFFSANAYALKSHLPIVVNATQLAKRFPHLILPHIVWLDRQHAVAAISDNRAITESNLHLLVTGQALHIRQKTDLLHFDDSKPVLTGTPQTGDANLFTSALSGYIDGTESSSGIHQDDSLHTRYLSLNVSALYLYQMISGLPNNLMIPEVNNTGRFRMQNTHEWEEKNLLTYELVTPASLPFADVRKLQKADFDRYLGYSTGFEKRPLSCWALVRRNATGTPSNDTVPVLHLSNSDSEWIATGVTGATLVNALNNMAAVGGSVFLDETGGGLISLSATVPDVNDIPSLQKALLRNGLDLEKRTRTMDVFVIRDAADATPLSRSQ